MDMDLEEYYKNPAIDSWTYVSMGMDKLKEIDPAAFAAIKARQEELVQERREMLDFVFQNSRVLGWEESRVQQYLGDFEQRFPLALRKNVAWDDPAFIFLYLLARICRPLVMIETGSNIGFSSSFIALAIKDNSNGAKFFTIDPYLDYEWKTMSFYEHNAVRQQKINYAKVNGRCAPLAIVPADLRELIQLKSGYSRDVLPGILRENPQVDIFFHDSDHGYRNMIWECAVALPQVPVGGYVLVHDINLNTAFKEMFGEEGVEIKENLGLYKKTRPDIALDGNWPSPEQNSLLNSQEYAAGKTVLESSPRRIIMQLGGVCGLHCVFCPGKKEEEEFNFDNFYRKVESKIVRFLAQAEQLVFVSCGGFFESGELRRMINWRINCVELNFPEIEKIYITNGRDLTPQAIDFIACPGGICGREYGVKNTVNVMLGASNSKMYQLLTRSLDFYQVLENVQKLISARADKNSLKIILSFLATTLNIEDLPDFLRLAASLGVDKVECAYACIHAPGQKYLSCFFKQKMTNEILEKSRQLAAQLNLEVSLPPLFGSQKQPSRVCPRAWEQMTINGAGDVLDCCGSFATGENLLQKPFIQAWNGDYYQKLRKDAVSGGCKNCFSGDPAAVNEFCSHLRGITDTAADVLWADNF